MIFYDTNEASRRYFRFFIIFTKTTVHFFPDQNGVVVRTDETIDSRFRDEPLAVYFDKNTYDLELRPREYVVPAVLCEQGTVLNHFTGITQYTHRSLLALHSTLTDPYWHYTVHSQILTGITQYTHRSLLALHSTLTDPCWHYMIYTHRSLLTLQGTHTDPY